MNTLDSAGKRNSTNFNSIFFAAVTPTINGRIQKILILINLITTTNAKKANSNLLLKNFSKTNQKQIVSITINLYFKIRRQRHSLIFLNRIRPVPWPLASTSVRGMNSTLTSAPFPSNFRGVTRNVAPSKNVSGNFSSMLCDIMKLLNFPAKASVTSSRGVSENCSKKKVSMR